MKIYTVKRLSDDEIFTIGDRTNCGVISEFNIADDRIIVSFTNKTFSFLDPKDLSLNKLKLLFTSKDGVDIFEEDESYYVNIENGYPFYICRNPPFSGRSKANELMFKNIGLYFSTREKVEEYLKKNVYVKNS